VKGLNGGHSGMDIHKGLGNANKIMNRILYNLSLNLGVMISEIEGGSLRNAIPRESICKIAIHPQQKHIFESQILAIKNDIINEYKSIEPKLEILYESTENPRSAIDPVDEIRILKAIYTAHNGVFRMSPEISELVEASNNIARVDIKSGQAKVMCLTRSSVESSKVDVVNSLTASFELAGFEVETSGDYPGWSPNVNSEILKVATNLYESINHNTPRVVACHAGLECGIIGGHYPDVDMISFGPNIKGAHSPDEKVNISSVQKYWNFLTELLKITP
jgi:dipeptidase D